MVGADRAPGEAEKLEPQLVKGREAPVVAYRIGSRRSKEADR